MSYRTIYDLSTEKIHFFSLPLPLSYLFLTMGIIFLIKNLRQNNATFQNPNGIIVGAGFIIISIGFLNVFLLRQFTNRYNARKVLESGNFFVVEGKPQNYHPMPRAGHDTERFDIQNIHFGYSDYNAYAPGYHNAASLGGVITPKNYYRFTYYKIRDIDSNRIIKIEIANQ